MLLLTLVSAIGNKNIGIKFPAKAASKSHFNCFIGKFFQFKIAIGDNKIPEIRLYLSTNNLSQSIEFKNLNQIHFFATNAFTYRQ
jgi:hypothetical protein